MDTGHQPPVKDRTLADAAQLLGLSKDAVRKRVARGSLSGFKQDGHWFIHLNEENETSPDDRTRPDNDRTRDQNNHTSDSRDEVIALLKQQLETQTKELDARRREVQELHVLLQQTALQSPQRSWWRFW